MNKKIVTIGFIIISLLYSSINAQELLTLDGCRNLAIENNKDLKIASEQERIAYYQKKEAFTKYLPEFSATGAYLHLQHKLDIIPSVVTIPSIGGLPSLDVPLPDKLGEIDLRNIFVGNLSLTQPLFMGGRIVAYNDIQKNAEELAKTRKDAKMQDVIAETDAAYWQVVSLSWKKKLAESYVELLKKMESDVNIMLEEGVATKADLLTVSVKLNEGEMALTKVDNGLSLSRMLLNQLCGIEENRQNILADENKDVLAGEAIEPVIPDVQEALSNRPEIKSLEIASKMYKAKERIEFADFLPQAGLIGGYTWTNPSSRNGFEKKFAGGWNIGVTVKVPFSLGNFPKLNAAKAQTVISRLQLEDAKEKIELQVNQNAYKLNEANKKLIAAEKNLDKADENLRYAKVGFEEGVIPSSDVLAAHTAWLQAHSEVIDARIDVKLSKVYLDKSLGRGL
ncbi:TolC family protein [Dysgonomonas sp. 520]|uniref:TolC family protein n=1 Tax=Dysgonomonas sp. 520 TaxID=2302931 RepID=UPI0013D41CD7|nr:TolC family protein [Dysgonomonas sp. 520]NDW11033.1 TolC family protein [Dysgonomonas sp. 520]